MAYTFGFEKLEVYTDARLYVKEIYKATALFPDYEQFALTSQIRRAAISVSSNIVEGISRLTNKEKCRFIEIAYGSLMETYCQLQIAVDLEYIDETIMKEIQPQIEKIANKLNGLKRYYINN